MGMNLDLGKQSFESLLVQMETVTKMQFVIWLDEKLAEFKVQGFMNFTRESVPQWLRNYSVFMKKSGLTLLGEPLSSQPQKPTIQPPTPAKIKPIVRTATVDTNARRRTPHSEVNLLKEEPPDPVQKDVILVKTEPEEEEEDDDDVVMVLPEDVPEPAGHYPQPDRLYRSSYAIQQRPSKLLRPSHRFTPKNSYAAAVAARKRRHNRPSATQRVVESMAHPPQEQVPHIHPQQPDHSQSIYAAGDYDDGSGYVETDPSVLAEQSYVSGDHSFASNEEYIQFPIGSADRMPHVKSEFYEPESDVTVSFNDSSVSEQQMAMLESGDQAYDASYSAEGGMEAGTSGMQESWTTWFPTGYDSQPPPSHDADSALGLVCHACGKTFTTRISHAHHALTHTEEQYKCTRCASVFTRTDDLKRHLKHVHCESDTWRVRCPICPKMSSSYSNHRQHVATHSKEKRFRCTQCDAAFTRGNDLRRHARTVHP